MLLTSFGNQPLPASIEVDAGGGEDAGFTGHHKDSSLTESLH